MNAFQKLYRRIMNIPPARSCDHRDCGKALRCPFCGGTNVKPRGFVGVNHRHECQDCGGAEGWC